MPPKRTSSSKSNGNRTKRAKRPTAPVKRQQTSGSDQNEVVEDEDSEKEIETFKDYEDAVRRRILTSTTTRYDDSLEGNQMAFAASLMMDPSDLSSEEITTIPRPVVYTLGTFCLNAIVEDFKHLASDAVMTPSMDQSAQQQRERQQRVQRNQHGQRRRGAFFRKQVQQLPFYLSAKLFKFLKHSKPELLSTKIWTSLFYPVEEDAGGGKSGTGFGITELDLEGLIASQVTDHVIRNHILGTLDLGPQLERVNLNYMDNLSDKVLAQLVGSCPHLTRLSLKGCAKAGNLTLARLTQESLDELNISFVAAPTAKGIKQMIMQCRGLRVLKMAGVSDIKDALFLEIEKELAADITATRSDNKESNESVPPLPLSALETLKISSTKLGDRGLKALLSLCGKTLERLDISATNVTRVTSIVQFCIQTSILPNEDTTMSGPESDEGAAGTAPSKRPKTSATRTRVTNLKKLNLTRLKIATPAELLFLFKELPPHSLHTLLAGYISNLVPVRDEHIDQLCSYFEPNRPSHDDPTHHGATHTSPFTPMPAIVPKYHLHTLSLFGNSQVGVSKRPDYGLHLLLRHLSPFLKRLELGYTQCKAPILEGLVPDGEDGQSDTVQDNTVLEELGLDGTPIDDDATMVLSRFRKLNRLSLANTRIGKEAVEIIIGACPLLTSLDLTSCRGIPLLHRRTLLKEVRQAISASASS
ncbi:hypothetical protein B0O80DRAFT_422436 [Mortierella sp. GBAus27b]|nr:hypothetical protein B0O80DRAFT_422436 [Mortierella sp. GBAus27b]